MIESAPELHKQRRGLLAFTFRLRRNPWLFLTYVILIAYAFISLYPIIWMLLMSLKTNPEVHTNLFGLPYGAPNEWQWDNYIHVLTTTRIPRYILNSAWISAVTVLGILLFALPAGFAFGQLEFKALAH